MNGSPLLLLSLPQVLVLLEVILAVIAISLMVYLSTGRRSGARQQAALWLIGLLVLIALLLGGVQYLIR